MAGTSAVGGAGAADKPGAAVAGGKTVASTARQANRHRDIDDDDEQLAAYNAYLARLGEAESGRGVPGRG